MALKQFKHIIDNKAYSVNAKDRKIFERNVSKSLFGIGGTDIYHHGKTDVIEFILYDSNDNQLPQGDHGDLVRYIYVNDAKISEYIYINDDPDKTKINESRQYTINTELLIKEAGYTNGIFKTQITLLNRRIGEDTNKFDGLWIHEISPSRTEIRVLPIKNDDDVIISDLNDRYSVFTDDTDFRDDTILLINSFIENINIQTVLENFLTIKGTTDDGQTYINLIKSEFKIQDFDKFLNKIKIGYIESMLHFSANRVYDINSLIYGEPLSTEPSISLSIDKIIEIASTVLHDVIDYYLFKRDIIKDSILSKEDQITFDPIKDILKTTTKNSNYESTIPESVSAIIRGCTDPSALNYNSLAKEDDGSCEYIPDPIVVLDVRGCTNPDALNFNPLATIDDGSCEFPIPDDPDKVGFEPNTFTTKTFYVWSTKGIIEYTNKKAITRWKGFEYDKVTITYRTANGVKFTGDIREVPKIRVIENVCQHLFAINFGEVGPCIFPAPPIVDDTIIVFNPIQTTPIIRIGGGNRDLLNFDENISGNNVRIFKPIREL